MKDAKYLLAYITPFTAFLSIYLAGYWSFTTLIFVFGVVPALEFFTPNSEKNLTTSEEENKLKSTFFDLILYLNLPILFGLLWYYFQSISTYQYATYELVGMTSAAGVIVGGIGINVAHELGHRSNKLEQFMSKALLLSALYMHFFIEHNRGHHKYVATDLDPASARKGQNLYAFWVRSTVLGYLNAWKLERNRLEKKGLSFFSVQNQMIQFQLIQIAYLLSVGLLFGWTTVLFAIAIAVFGFLLLETVNYVEHYGLRRQLKENGHYEKVLPKHSWNSDHEVGRILLYELTRHSDHHYKASRKYQVLRHMDDSPQLPLGYPGSMILSMVPPLWFNVMNKTLERNLNKAI